MSYTRHFSLADAYIAHTNTIVGGISDGFIQQRYTGFVTISAVTAYELAIKEIFINFAMKKHKVFGVYVDGIYERINGRISLSDLRKNHIAGFGEKYLNRFNRELNKEDDASLRSVKRSITASYRNVIMWRHEFVHTGTVAINASYQEAVNAYEDGKLVIDVLARTMVR